MNIIVTFDANFIIENKGIIGNIISDVKNNYELFISQLVIEEVKGKRIRQTIKNYKNIKDKIEEAKKENKWLNISDETNIEEITQEQEKKLDEWLIKAFNNNIIKINSNNLLEKILERCKYKKPPFNNDDGASDKGFKDTILFLTLMEFIIDREFDEIYLFTSDKVINKYKLELEKEFFETTRKKINIIDSNLNDLYEILNIEKINKKSSDLNQNDEEMFPKAQDNKNDIKVRTTKILNDIFTDLEIANGWSFVTWEKVKLEDIKNILEGLKEKINIFIFLEEIDVNNIFEVDSKKGK